MGNSNNLLLQLLQLVTVEFAVQVICARSLFQELPTFVDLGILLSDHHGWLLSDGIRITTFFVGHGTDP